MHYVPILCVGFLSAIPCHTFADVVTLNPVADAFVDSAQPDSNYGGGGALQIAASGSARGEFQTVLRFDTASAAAAFDATYGAGQWVIQSITLQLTATPPNNGLFNPQAAGDFAISWMQNDSWVEGIGMPSSPGTEGVTFNSLPTFLSPADEPVGTFTASAATTGAATYTLGITSGFAADINAGNLVSLRLSVPGSATAYTFNSRNFGTVANRPLLAVTAVGGVLCGSADFNCDGDTGTDADIEAFFACLAGSCPAPPCTGTADFNGDGDVGTDADIETFFRVLAGGSC